MDMVFRHMPFHDFHFVLPADVTDQVTNAQGYVARQGGPPILRNPHQMQVDLKYRMRPPVDSLASPQLTGGARAEAVACKARASTLPD